MILPDFEKVIIRSLLIGIGGIIFGIICLGGLIYVLCRGG